MKMYMKMAMKLLTKILMIIKRLWISLQPILLKLSVKIICKLLLTGLIICTDLLLFGGIVPIHLDSEDRDIDSTNNVSSNTPTVNFNPEGLTDQQHREQVYNYIWPQRASSDPLLAKVGGQYITLLNTPRLIEKDTHLSSIAWHNADPTPGNNFLNSEDYQELMRRAKASGKFGSRVFPNGKELLFYNEPGVAKPQDIFIEARASWKLVEAIANNPPTKS
uniref:hypothetical protein n=1 Tax=Myrothecium inundatum TaxID=110576 RepID=UPI001EDD1737|nr:hypothetical protein MFQ09_mgp13 [Myrothecium inundatum]UIX25782.1 hypothetical protein [Myrothecium inundatum]